MDKKLETQGIIMESAEPKSSVGQQPTKASAYAKASNGDPVSWAQFEFFAEDGLMVRVFSSGSLLAFSDGSIILRDNKTKSEYVLNTAAETQAYIEHGLQVDDEFCRDLMHHITEQNNMMAEAIKNMR